MRSYGWWPHPYPRTERGRTIQTGRSTAGRRPLRPPFATGPESGVQPDRWYQQTRCQRPRLARPGAPEAPDVEASDAYNTMRDRRWQSPHGRRCWENSAVVHGTPGVEIRHGCFSEGHDPGPAAGAPV